MKIGILNAVPIQQSNTSGAARRQLRFRKSRSRIDYRPADE
jgi:hypothetical protein